MKYDDQKEHYGVTLTFKEDVEEHAGIITLCNVLQRYRTKFNYQVYPEFGKKNHRFHFHMLIQVSEENRCQYSSFVNTWKRNRGRTTFTRLLTPKGYVKTEEYISKDKTEMMSFFHIPLPLTHDNSWDIKKVIQRVLLNKVAPKLDEEINLHDMWSYIDNL